MAAQVAKSGPHCTPRREQHYRCTNSGCRCEIKIAREPFVGVPIVQNLRCCCGSAMERAS